VNRSRQRASQVPNSLCGSTAPSPPDRLPRRRALTPRPVSVRALRVGWRALLAVGFVLSTLGAAQAADMDGRRAIGYARAIGGPAGLSFQYGAGNLIVEAILGLQYKSFSDEAEAGPPRTFIDAAIGGHFQLLRAQSAALTFGGRFNLGLGKTDAQEPTDVTQVGVDLPLRVYWWPTKNISVHSEFGISILFGPEQGVLHGVGEVAEKGVTARLFDGFGDSAFGQMGLSFWW
jgi:hypothetical protein